MTSQQAMYRLIGKNGERSGIIYNWVKQGVLQAKDFSALINTYIEQEAKRIANEQRRNEVQDETETSSIELEFQERVG